MFCAIISPVQVATCPVVPELALCFSASLPVEAPVHSFQLFWDDSVIHYPCSSGIVCLEGGFWLWPLHFLEGLSHCYHLLCRDEHCAEFGSRVCTA